ncbi:MAG TPA: hypothetical protein DHW71_06805 [Gammaproteobacteria bacterium]|nr:hypothetical protein [Gammaproteobacteria bacterium]
MEFSQLTSPQIKVQDEQTAHQDLLKSNLPKSKLFAAMLDGANQHFKHHAYKNIWLGINKLALIHNAQFLKKRSPQQKLCAVLKSDAYGHGIDIVTPILEPLVDCYAITETHEASLIRQISQKTIIRIRPATALEVIQGLKEGLDIQETVGSNDQALMLGQLAVTNKTRIKIHLNIDSTGMGHDGYSSNLKAWEITLNQIEQLLMHPGLDIVGIMGHLPKSGDVDTQAALCKVYDFVEKAFIIKEKFNLKNIETHIFSSAGLLRSHEIPLEIRCHLTMNRVGAALFGQKSFHCEDVSSLRHVMNACTFIADVYTRYAGEQSGYGGYYTVVREKEQHALTAGGWTIMPREALRGDSNDRGIAPIKLVNEQGHYHDVLGNPSMNSLACNALSCNGDYLLSRNDPVFIMADPAFVPGQTSNTISHYVQSPPSRITTTLGNPYYAARFIIEYHE